MGDEHLTSSIAHSIARQLQKHRKHLLACLILATLIAALPMGRVTLDPSGVAFDEDRSEAYRDYQSLIESFGNDHYVILATGNPLSLDTPELKARLDTVRRNFLAMDTVLGVIDPGSILASEAVRRVGKTAFQNEQSADRLHRIIPGLGRLISEDKHTLAVIVSIDNDQLNGFRFEKELKRMKQIVDDAFPEQAPCHAAGIPVLRAAFERYNLISAMVFGSLGLVFGTAIAVFLFKTWWAAVLVIISSLVSLVWTLGIMGALAIPVTIATGLSFGFVLIVSATTTFHILSNYRDFLSGGAQDRALEKTVEKLLRPCFMCALTTSAGFLTLTISPLSMVAQAGISISTGVMLAFIASLLITSVSLPVMIVPADTPRNRPDILDAMILKPLSAGLKQPGFWTLTGVLFLVVMAWGIPEIETVRHLTTPMIHSTPEAKDIRFTEERLSAGFDISLVVEPKDHPAESRRFWNDVYRLENRLEAIQGIRSIDSVTAFVFHLAKRLSPLGIQPEFIFRQLASGNARDTLLKPYFDPDANRFRIGITLKDASSDQIETFLEKIRAAAENSFSGPVRIRLSGQLMVLRSQTSDLVSSQTRALFLALSAITVLMMIQLRSVTLGFISLIPNILPLVTIFGIMGWFRIPLDPLTVFAAVISFGLSVDDSIHYLTQLKREMMEGSGILTLRQGLETAYGKTSRALVSTTAVLFLSSLGLVFSPFQHVVSLGILIASASLVALLGDLVFMPAVVLCFKPLHAFLSTRLTPVTFTPDQRLKNGTRDNDEPPR